MAIPDELVRTTCPRDCYDACGAIVIRREGRIHAVRGDPEHPVSRGRLCRKCTLGYNGAFLDPAARLTRPLVRTGPKGTAAFREASWDEALALVAGRLDEIVAGPGPEAVLNTHYTGTFAQLGYGYGQRFFNRLGATEVDPDSVCNLAGHIALGYLYGTSELGFDPRTAKDAACILVWGANPSVSAPHADEHWLGEAPGNVVVVDPIATGTARRADLHLQPFPGSDAALAFALASVLARDGLLDEPFLGARCAGGEELLEAIAGCDLAALARATGVPAASIEQAAHLYGPGPSLLWLGQGMQRQPRGGNAMRAVAMLPALTGNLCRPGTGFLYLNGSERRGIDGDDVTGAGLAAAERPVVSQMDLAARLEDAARSRALFCWNINIAASNPEQARLRAALARDDLFTVAIDVFATDTTDLADVVLPAASFLECDDLVLSYFDLTVSAQVKAGDPPGEALPNPEIFRRLAGAMGWTEPALHEPDDVVIERLLEQTGVGLTFAQLARVGTVPYRAEPLVQFADGAFATPSGRVELASDAAAADGHPRVPVPHADPRPADGRLRLLSPASPWLLNDSFGNDAKVLRRLGPALVALHPDDAAERGLAQGAPVLVHNDTGRLELVLEVSDAVPRGVALSPKGRWPKREAAGANVNVLNPGRKADMGAATAVHGVEVFVDAPA
jgi:anaerobic selenocysteine-containing dehydrogenase